MNYKNIIIAGYPKSGTTWLTRLTAEIIGCPIESFWGEPEGFEIAAEGRERSSSYRCYKSHHQLDEIDLHSRKTYEAIIYLVRDPRDIIVSGSRYFYPPRFGLLGRIARRTPYVGKAFKQLANTSKYRINRMTQAVLSGDESVNAWCGVDWGTHVSPYLESEHLVLRYEDLLENAQKSCYKILDHIGESRTQKEVEDSVYRQSMEFKKKVFMDRGEVGKANFMKSGTRGQWREKLPSSDIQKVEEAFNSLLEYLGYPIVSK